ncbi:MAG: TetR/AcrR family transcriptional regulator [Pseudolabrys sp.]
MPGVNIRVHWCAMIRKRRYTLKRRAENQAETRRRIVEATVDLHAELGPAHTSITAIAERAGVQRHTVYAHFPTERELGLACSGLAFQRDPLPDERAWRGVTDPDQRLRRALTEIYAWYDRNAELIGSVMRDAEVDPLTRDIARLRFGSRMPAFQAALTRGLRPGRELHAALGLALSFHTWRSLVKDGGLSNDAAVSFVLRAVHCVAEKPKRTAIA